MDQKQQTKSNRCKHNEQGVALIYALVVMAVIFALALALLYGVGQVSIMTTSNRVQEDCYFQALTLSEVIDRELTKATPDVSEGTIYHMAYKYMPPCDSDSVEESMELEAAGLNSDYGKVVLHFQNGVDPNNGVQDLPNWDSKDLSKQYLDLTVEVWGVKGGKESLKTRYLCCQHLNDSDMIYTLKTNMYTGDDEEYICQPVEGGFFLVTDQEETPNTIETQLCIWGDDASNRDLPVTMEQAENWKGEKQDLGTHNINEKSVDVTFQLTRKRLEWESGDNGSEESGDNGNEESEGNAGQIDPTDKVFKRVYTR